jgi:hypothetical protein
VVNVVSSPASATTAWSNGTLQINQLDWVRHSNIIFNAPYAAGETAITDYLPVGNGQIGAPIWADKTAGYVAQIDDDDMILANYRHGRLTIPGLAPMINAPDYHAVLDLATATLTQTGTVGRRQVKAVSYVDSRSNRLIVQVTGLAANSAQTADLMLWTTSSDDQPARNPTIVASGGWGGMGEYFTQTFTDPTDTNPPMTIGLSEAIVTSDPNAVASDDQQATSAAMHSPSTSGGVGYAATLSPTGTYSGVRVILQGSANAQYYIEVHSAAGSTVASSLVWTAAPATATAIDLKFSPTQLGKVILYSRSTNGKLAKDYYTGVTLTGSSGTANYTIPLNPSAWRRSRSSTGADGWFPPPGVSVAFNADASGAFRLEVATTCAWNGRNLSQEIASLVADTAPLTGDTVLATTRNDWQAIWDHIAPIGLRSNAQSVDPGLAEFVEHLRVLDLYLSELGGKGEYPITQGGNSRVFDPVPEYEDKWGYANFYMQNWNFNMRLNYAPLAAAGAWDLLKPYFDWYTSREVYPQLKATTARNFTTGGVCITDNETADGRELLYIDNNPHDGRFLFCNPNDAFWTTRQYQVGPEVVLHMVHAAQISNDWSYVDAHKKFIEDVGTFYADFPTLDSRGRYVYNHVNDLEDYWDTENSAPIVAAARAFFPVLHSLAKRWAFQAGATQADLNYVATTAGYLTHLPLPTISNGKLADYQIAYDGLNNRQDTAMEYVWPFDLYGDDSSTNAVAVQTYEHQMFPEPYEWDPDTTWAARLGLSARIEPSLDRQVAYLSDDGIDLSSGVTGSAALEMLGPPTQGIQEALVQDYDGTLRIAPAIPPGFDVEGTVYIPGGHRVSVETRNGQVVLAGIQAASNGVLHIRDPWPGQSWQVLSGDGSSLSGFTATTAQYIDLTVVRGHSYLIEETGHPYSAMTVAAIDDSPASQPLTYGRHTLGVR